MNNFLNELNADATLIENPVNRMYYTGINTTDGFLVMTKKKTYFITDFRYIEAAEAALKDTNIKTVLQDKLYDQINEIIISEGIKTLALECSYQTVLSAAKYKQKLQCEIPEITNLDMLINESREIKTESEIANIKKAQEITDNAFSMILGKIQPGMTEKDLSLEIEFFMRKSGAEGVSFDLITIAGENTSLPHGVPTDRKLQKGDFVTMDIGCKYNGYCSDMTRTVALGWVTDKQRNVYEKVLEAQTAALEKIKSGLSGFDADKIARDIIYGGGYEGCFGHGLGHGVGLEIHESPRLSPTSKRILKSGMVVTVEPGIYLKNEFGVRIEDMVIVTDNGCDDLTKSIKELIIL